MKKGSHPKKIIAELEGEKAQELARWLIHSPPLWKASVELSERLIHWWSEEHERVKAWEGIFDLPRIGRLAEELLERFIVLSPALNLLRRGWAIREEGITIGEIDFLVETPAGIEHWELGIKFFLLDDKTLTYIGPNGRDRLDLKLKKMMTRQLPLGQHPQVKAWCKEKGVGSPVTTPLLKGRLYAPTGMDLMSGKIASELCLGLDRGAFVFQEDLERHLTRWKEMGLKFFPLERRDWLSGQIKMEKTIKKEIDWNAPKPFQGVLLKKENEWAEVERVFVVPKSWPNCS